MYIEASAPRVRREFAKLNYKFPSPSTVGCFSMYYHTYGSQLGVLRVDLTTTNHKTFVAWRNNGRANVDLWQQVSINIPATTTEVNLQTILQNIVRLIVKNGDFEQFAKLYILKALHAKDLLPPLQAFDIATSSLI